MEHMREMGISCRLSGVHIALLLRMAASEFAKIGFQVKVLLTLLTHSSPTLLFRTP